MASAKQWDGWPREKRACWLCLFASEYLGVDTLADVHVFLTGYDSLTDWLSSRNPAAATAVLNLRGMLPPHVTRDVVRAIIRDYAAACREGAGGPYRIDPKTRRFRLEFDSPELDFARARLSSIPDGDGPKELPVADPERPMTTELMDREVPLGAMGKLPITAIRHDVSSRPRPGLSVTIDDLLATARDMDQADRSRCDEDNGWERRLSGILFLSPAAHGLVEQGELRLEGLKHLIGLPGVGKTTLFTVLGVHLGRRGIRTLLLFPTIEVSRAYKETIERYGVRVGMLVGQSDPSRVRHAQRVAEAIAAKGNRGFGETVPGAADFSLSCMLPAFAVQEADAEMWARDFPTYAPCSAVWNSGEGRPKGASWCPLWSACGRHHASRMLPSTDVWVGHVISTDTSVPLPLIGQKMRYFELVGRTFDLVVFDEADAVQALLDQHGIEQMVLNGDRGSLHDKIIEHVFKPRAGGLGGNLATASHERMRSFTEFHIQSESLITAVMSNLAVLQRDFANKLLTAYSILAKLMENSGVEAGIVSGIRSFWENAARAAYADRTGLQDGRKADWQPGVRLEDFAGENGEAIDAAIAETEGERPLQDDAATADRRMLKARRTLVRRFRDYLNETTNEGRDEVTEKITKLMAPLMFPRGHGKPDHLLEKMKMLMGVTFQIVAFQHITRMMRAMVEEGSLSPDAFASTSSASQELRRFVPTSILSVLSGVRFMVSEDEAGRRRSKVEYLMFTSAARMLIYRLHRLVEAWGMGGPAVIAASATSFLEFSPTHHVDAGPHYVLAHREDVADPSEGGAPPSRYKFLPLRDGGDGGRPIFYSGAQHSVREDNLRRMVDVLLEGGADSMLYRAIDSFDVVESDGHRHRRKAAFVVNSYDHVRLLKRHIDSRHKEIGPRVRAVVRNLEKGDEAPYYMTAAQAEQIGDDDGCDIVIFPMAALGRGTNIVFRKDPRKRHAAIGTVYFLTRPHPTEDDTGFLVNLAGEASMRFDAFRFSDDDTIGDVVAEWERQRKAAFSLALKLLAQPFRVNVLNNELYERFVAQQMVMVLQTIGRAMRGNRPAQVYFVDAAWAPNSAASGDDPEAKGDTERESMLLKMRALLEACCTHRDPLHADIYRRLFMPFLEPFRALQGVNAQLGKPARKEDEEPDEADFDEDYDDE
jgi:hypothetical protein